MPPRKSWRTPRASPPTRFQMTIFPGDCVHNEPCGRPLPSLVVAGAHSNTRLLCAGGSSRAFGVLMRGPLRGQTVSRYLRTRAVCKIHWTEASQRRGLSSPSSSCTTFKSGVSNGTLSGSPPGGSMPWPRKKEGPRIARPRPSALERRACPQSGGNRVNVTGPSTLACRVPRGEGAAVLNSVSGSGLPPDHARYLHRGPLAVAQRCRDAASV